MMNLQGSESHSPGRAFHQGPGFAVWLSRALTRLCPLMTRAYSPATASSTDGSFGAGSFSWKANPFPTACEEESIIFARAFLTGEGEREEEEETRVRERARPPFP